MLRLAVWIAGISIGMARTRTSRIDISSSWVAETREVIAAKGQTVTLFSPLFPLGLHLGQLQVVTSGPAVSETQTSATEESCRVSSSGWSLHLETDN